MNHKSLLMLLFVIECMVMEKGFSVQCGACKSTIGWKDCYVKQKVQNCTKPNQNQVCMKVRRTAHYHKNISQILYFVGCMPKRDCNIDFCHRPLDSTERKKLVNASCDQLECRPENEYHATTSQVKTTSAVRKDPISLAVPVDLSEASDLPLQCGSCRSHVSWDDCSTKLKLQNCNKTDVCMKVKWRALYHNNTRRNVYFIGCMPKRNCTMKFCRTLIDDTERKIINASCDQLECRGENKYPATTPQVKKTSAVRKDPIYLAVPVGRSEASDVPLQCGSCRSSIGWNDCSTKLKLEDCKKTDVCMKAIRTAQYGTNPGTFQSLYFIGCMPKRDCTMKFCRTPFDKDEIKKLKAVSCKQLACWTGNGATPVPKDPSTLAVVNRSEASDLRLHGLLSTLVAFGVVCAV